MRPAETHAFVADAFRDGAIPTTGTAITRILPPASRFAPSGGHAATKQSTLAKLLRSSIATLGLPSRLQHKECGRATSLEAEFGAHYHAIAMAAVSQASVRGRST